MRLRLFALFFSSICFLEVAGQDPHFSQFYASPLTLNPALTGLFAGEGRISSTYRNQWQSISNPFTTGTVAFDTRALRRVFKEQNVFGLGGMALYDQSNNGGLRSRYLAFTAGYNQQLDKYGHHRLGIGFQVDFRNKNVTSSDIYEAMLYLSDCGIKITNKKLSLHLKVSERTILRNMDPELKKEKNLLNKEMNEKLQRSELCSLQE